MWIWGNYFDWYLFFSNRSSYLILILNLSLIFSIASIDLILRWLRRDCCDICWGFIDVWLWGLFWNYSSSYHVLYFDMRGKGCENLIIGRRKVVFYYRRDVITVVFRKLFMNFGWLRYYWLILVVIHFYLFFGEVKIWIFFIMFVVSFIDCMVGLLDVELHRFGNIYLGNWLDLDRGFWICFNIWFLWGLWVRIEGSVCGWVGGWGSGVLLIVRVISLILFFYFFWGEVVIFCFMHILVLIIFWRSYCRRWYRVWYNFWIFLILIFMIMRYWWYYLMIWFIF